MTGAGEMTRQDAATFFELYGPMVYRRARSILGNPADAEEATQEVFIRALRSAEGFEGRSSVSTWLYRITTNHCLNQIRNRHRRTELFEEHVVDRQPTSTDGRAAAAIIHLSAFLAQADEQQAQAAVYVFVDGMSHDEAADLLGVSRRTVGNLLERFRAWAQRRYARDERTGPWVASTSI